MALWQFISLSVPIVALLVYVAVLTTRVGLANTRLKQIAETLQSLERRPVQANVASGEVTRSGASSESSNGHAGYQTIRTLRAKQTLPASPATSAPSTSTHSPSAPAQNTTPVQAARERHRSRKVNGAARRAPAADSIDEVYIPPYLRVRVDPELAGGPGITATTYSTTNSDPVEATSDAAYRPKASASQRGASVTTPEENGFGEVMTATTQTHGAAEAPASISVPDIAGEAMAQTAEAHALAVEEAAVLMPAIPAADIDAQATALILELSGPLRSVPASDEAPSASSESRQPPEVVASANDSSSNSPSEADALAKKKNRDALVFLNNQRRRRRRQRAS